MQILGGISLGLALSVFIMTRMNYGDYDERESMVLDALSDIYASPVRGKRIALE